MQGKIHTKTILKGSINMIEDITLRAFDEIVNPVILCELDGKTIYKNTEAKKSLRKPALGGKLQTHLSYDYRYLLNERADPRNFPVFVEIDSDGDLLGAFVDVVYYECRPTLLLVFSHLLLYELSVPLFVTPPNTLRHEMSGERLARLVTNIYSSDLIVEASRNRAHHKRMTQVFYKLVDTLLTELSYGNDRIRYPLAYSINILSYACNKVLSHLGLDILFDLQYEYADSTFVDFKSMILLAANFILLAAEISDSHIIHAIVEEGKDGEVIFRFPITLKKPNSLIPLGGAGSFTELLPGRSVDLFFFDKICKSSQYHFDFTLNPNEATNLRLRLHTPITRKLPLREADIFRMDDAIRIIDRLANKLLAEIENEAPLT